MNARFHASRVGQGMCVVTGEREAHAQTAEDLREALSAAVAGGCKRVLVDLQESEHVDPLVLGAILGSQRRVFPLWGGIGGFLLRGNRLPGPRRGGGTPRDRGVGESPRGFRRVRGEGG